MQPSKEETMKNRKGTHTRVQAIEGVQASYYGVNTCDSLQKCLVNYVRADGFHRHRSSEQLIEVQLREDRIWDIQGKCPKGKKLEEQRNKNVKILTYIRRDSYLFFLHFETSTYSLYF